MKQIKLFSFLSLWLVTQFIYAAQPSPLPMLQQSANSILKVLDENQSELKKDNSIIYKSVKRYLLPNVDVYGMSRSVLGRNAWRKASKSQRQAFANQFTQLVIRTYASPLAEYDGEKIKFYPIRGGYNKRFVSVKSMIIRPSASNIPLAYSLIYKKGQWKIYDISVEGVSLLESFRSQFAQQLQHASINALIKKMQQHNQKQAG